MKTNGVVIFTVVLLGAIGVNAQQQAISQLRTQTITLSRKTPKDKAAAPRLWVLEAHPLKMVLTCTANC